MILFVYCTYFLESAQIAAATNPTTTFSISRVRLRKFKTNIIAAACGSTAVRNTGTTADVEININA